MPILYSCHPRSKKYIEQRGFILIKGHSSAASFDYNKLQQNAFCVVSDSGTVPEEGAYFKFPAVSVPLPEDRKLWIRACLQLVRLAQNRYCRQLNL